MNLFLGCVSADPLLGKIDKHSLSQQTLMELLIENITNKEAICGSTDTSTDISAWKGLTFNESDEIIEINWSFLYLEGCIDLKWLPRALKECTLDTNHLEGTIDLTCLPDTLEYLSLSNNKFVGSVDLTRLPPNMLNLYLSMNKFTGVTDFTQLPTVLKELNVGCTEIEGEIRAFDGILRIDKSYVKDMRKK